MSDGKGRTRIPAADWERLYRKHFLKLGHYFVSKGLDPAEAEDLAHEVFQQLGRSKMPEDPELFILHALWDAPSLIVTTIS